MACFRVLLAGDSPTLMYLSYVLQPPTWEVYVLCPSFSGPVSPWSIQFNNARPIVYTPTIVSSLADVANPQDLVVLSGSYFKEISRPVGKIRSLVHQHSVILCESNLYPWLHSAVLGQVDSVMVLEYFSSVDVRRLPTKNVMLRFIGACSISIGYPTASKSSEHAIQVLQLFKLTFDSGPLNATYFEGQKSLNKLVWKEIISTVCLGCCSLIYEKYRIIKLLSPQVYPIVKGCYHEILRLTHQLRIIGLPPPNSEESERLFDLLIYTENTAVKARKAQCAHNFNYLEANKLFYDYANNIPSCVEELLKYLENMAYTYKMAVPYFQCISSFVSRLLSMRKHRTSSLFQPKPSMLQFNNIKGIDPSHNMMNYPPFNPLPAPSPYLGHNSIVMMVGEDQKSAESIISVDSEIKHYVTRDEFFDASATPSTVPPVNSGDTQAATNCSSAATTAISPPELGPNFAPIQNGAYVNYNQGGASVLGYNGLTNEQPATVPIKRKPYHHLPPAITRNSSVAQLKRSYSNIIEAMNLQNEQSTSSRYGKYDTTYQMLQSNNNSRDSKNSSGSSKK